MLPRNYRITAYNDSGASCDVTVTARRWYIDPSTGQPSYEASEATLLSATGVADGFDLADWSRFRELLRHRARHARWLCIERRRGGRVTYRRYRL